MSAPVDCETRFPSGPRRKQLSPRKKLTLSSTSSTKTNVVPSSAVYLSTRPIRSSISTRQHGKRLVSTIVRPTSPIFNYPIPAGYGTGKHGMSTCREMLTKKAGSTPSASIRSILGMATILGSRRSSGEGDG